MKLLLLGLARGGKDTFCEIINKEFGVSFRSSSDYMNEHLIFPVLKDKYGYKSLEECYADRVNHRQEWYELIQEYNNKDQARLAKNILKENDIYCGMRCLTQFEASKNLFDLVVWIDAEERLGITESSKSMTIPKSEADIIITNNGTKEEFERKVKKVFSLLMTNSQPSIEDRKESFNKKVWAYYFKNKGKYSKEIITAFISYWNRVEENRLKHELPDKFYIGRRLSTFSKKQGEIEVQNRLNRFKNYLGKVNPKR